MRPWPGSRSPSAKGRSAGSRERASRRLHVRQRRLEWCLRGFPRIKRATPSSAASMTDGVQMKGSRGGRASPGSHVPGSGEPRQPPGIREIVPTWPYYKSPLACAATAMAAERLSLLAGKLSWSRRPKSAATEPGVGEGGRSAAGHGLPLKAGAPYRRNAAQARLEVESAAIIGTLPLPPAPRGRPRKDRRAGLCNAPSQEHRGILHSCKRNSRLTPHFHGSSLAATWRRPWASA